MTHAPGLQSGCSGLEQRVSLLATRRGKDDDNRLNSVIVCLKHSQVPSGSAWNELEQNRDNQARTLDNMRGLEKMLLQREERE
eukprot:1159866-Pelagomonas_calceolata.AAC.3